MLTASPRGRSHTVSSPPPPPPPNFLGLSFRHRGLSHLKTGAFPITSPPAVTCPWWLLQSCLTSLTSSCQAPPEFSPPALTLSSSVYSGLAPLASGPPIPPRTSKHPLKPTLQTPVPRPSSPLHRHLYAGHTRGASPPYLLPTLVS